MPREEKLACVEQAFSISTLAGKLTAHWDECNLLEVFQQIAAATVIKAEGQ
jgi:hypothetical protein